MTVVLTISTPDAAPTASPYKVSRITGKDTATLDFTVTGTGPLRAYRLKNGGVNILSGVTLREAGAICGLSKCGAAEAVPTAIPTPVARQIVLDDSEFAAEGTYPLSLYVYNGEVFE